MENTLKTVASLALFRQFNKKEKVDILMVLGDFIKNIVVSRSMKSFSSAEIKNKLSSEYDFKIPELIIVSSLKKFCEKKNGLFFPHESVFFENVNVENFENEKIESESLFKSLVDYVEMKTGRSLDSTQKEILTSDFCEYIIENDTKGTYIPLISSFILSLGENTQNKMILEKIRDGVVLYSGIKYTDSTSNLGGWKSALTLYAEQEVLFDYAGYHGTLFKEMFCDFLGLIREVNQKAGKSLVKIKFFGDVREAIERYFYIAEDIVKGKATLDCSRQAMVSIVDGCKDVNDVVRKRIEFFNLLKSACIEEEFQHFDPVSNPQYNLESEDLIANISKDWRDDDDDFQKSLDYINYINIERKGRSGAIENVSSILLSRNSKTMFVALHPSVKIPGKCPLASTIDYMTNLFWLRLNKGFGKNSSYPKSFDVVTKARIVLSTRVTGSISKEFDRLMKQYKDGSVQKDILIEELAELKNRTRKPEDINEANIDETLGIINIADTERYLRERDQERADAEAQRKENESLRELVRIKSDGYDEEKQQKLRLERDIEEQKLSFTKERESLKEQQYKKNLQNYDKLKRQKDNADGEVGRLLNRHKIFLACLVVLLFLCYCSIIFQVGWEKMDFVTYILGCVIFVFGVIFFIVKLRKFSIFSVLKKDILQYKRKQRQICYQKYVVNLDEMYDLKKLIADFEMSKV